MLQYNNQHKLVYIDPLDSHGEYEIIGMEDLMAKEKPTALSPRDYKDATSGPISPQ